MKQLILVAVILLSIIENNYAQKKVVTSNSTILNYGCNDLLQIIFPVNMSRSKIVYAYGRNQLEQSKCYFDNEGITFSTQINEPAIAVANSTVKSYYIEDDVYTLFVTKDNYTIVYSNLKKLNVKVGDQLNIGDTIGTIAEDENNTKFGCLEFMLFENKTPINPAKFINTENAKSNIVLCKI